MDRFKIFPSIGIARLGGSPNSFYIAPETPDSLGTEMDAGGTEHELEQFKDGGLIKRRGARFRVYEWDNLANNYAPVDMTKVTVTWSVHLANKKAAVVRPATPLAAPPALPIAKNATWQDLLIDGGEKVISGKMQSGVKFDDGKYKGNPIFLGELKTDINGNVIVIGGHGRSDSFDHPKPQLTKFYTTNGWFDDTADGTVKAQVKLADGSTFDAVSSWVIVAPPDFAPKINGVVTLYDVMFQVGVDQGKLAEQARPSFTLDILPIIARFRSLQWVNPRPEFTKITATDAQLAAQTPAQRQDTVKSVSDIADALLSRESPITGFQLSKFQLNILNNWTNDNFTNDFTTHPTSPLSPADQLNKTILDSGVGQGFFPGIEGGIIIKRPDIYLEPFRFNPGASIEPGDITALMALPWQADFTDCAGQWWPSQRPDIALRDGTFESWADGINSMQDMVDKFNSLGFIVPSGNQMVETERN